MSEEKMIAIQTFNADSIKRYCDRLAAMDGRIEAIIDRYGYPVLVEREAGFGGLVRLILEQQVSLASALAVWEKLEVKIGEICPEKILLLDDDGFQKCGFSRQKIRYVRALAQEILDNGLDLDALSCEPDDQVNQRLKRITGIGDWTCECYLLLCLKRLDIFPAGDLALFKSMKENGLVGKKADKENILKAALRFKPYRSILSYILWRAYLKKRGLVD